MKKNHFGGRPQMMHDRVPMLISFERDRLKEFEEQCHESKISVSEGIRQLVEQELEKKELGSDKNPIGVSYITYTNQKQKPFQSDLTQWFDTVNNITSQQELLVIKGQASHICGLADKRSMELHRQGIRK